MPARHIALFLAVTFGWSWAFWALPVLDHNGVALPEALDRLARQGSPAAWGPLIGAVAVALARGGTSGVRALARRAGQIRGRAMRRRGAGYMLVLGAAMLLAVSSAA